MLNSGVSESFCGGKHTVALERCYTWSRHESFPRTLPMHLFPLDAFGGILYNKPANVHKVFVLVL